MSQNHQSQDAAARDTSNAVQLFQDAHQKMVMLKRVEEQMAQLVQRRRTLMDELKQVQGQINDEFENLFHAAQEMPARLKGLAAGSAGSGVSSSGTVHAPRDTAFADDSVLTEDEAVA